MRYVLDSSVALKWVFDEQDSPQARQLRDDFQNGVHDLLAPDILPGETGNALTRAERQGQIQIGEALVLWSGLMAASPRLVPSLPLTSAAIAYSSQTRSSVFDCLYLVLAEREQCPLVTADERVVRNLQPTFPFIVPLSSLPLPPPTGGTAS
jgi:predicted nucleic acid-binding protein